MADAIYGILNYPALSKMFIKLGYDEVNNMKWENSARKVQKLYKEFVK
jgi:hypothetical protein